MQNRSKYGLKYVPLEFPDAFPLYIHDHLRHPSREIAVLHRHNCMELGFCVDGKGLFAVEGKIMDFRSGDFTVIGSSEAHLAASAPGTTSHWYWFYLDFERLLRPAFPETDLRFLGSLRGAAFRNVFNGTAYPWGPLILKQLFCAETKEEKIALLLLFSARLRDIRRFCGDGSGGGEVRIRTDCESGKLFRSALSGTDFRCGGGALVRDEYCKLPAGFSAGDGRCSAGLSEPSADLHGESGTPDGALADI